MMHALPPKMALVHYHGNKTDISLYILHVAVKLHIKPLPHHPLFLQIQLNPKGKTASDNKTIRNKSTRHIAWSVEFACVLLCFALKLGLYYLWMMTVIVHYSQCLLWWWTFDQCTCKLVWMAKTSMYSRVICSSAKNLLPAVV